MTALTLTQMMARKAQPTGLLCLVVIIPGLGAEPSRRGLLIEFGDGFVRPVASSERPHGRGF